MRPGSAKLLGLLALALLTGVDASAASAPPPSIALQPNCGPAGRPAPASPTPPPIGDLWLLAQAGYSITVIGRNLIPGGLVILFNPGAQQQAFQATADSHGMLQAVISPSLVPAGTYVVTIQEGGTLGPRALFVVPCPPVPSPSPSPVLSPSPSPPPGRFSPLPVVLNPTLMLTPDVGPTGTIVVAHGADFPANVVVQVAWSQGIVSTAPNPIVTDNSGAFTTSLLVFPHDAVGQRVMTAISTPPPDSTYVGFASASFLVVPGAVQPGDFTWRH